MDWDDDFELDEPGSRPRLGEEEEVMHFCGGWDDLAIYGGAALLWLGTYWRALVAWVRR